MIFAHRDRSQSHQDFHSRRSKTPYFHSTSRSKRRTSQLLELIFAYFPVRRTVLPGHFSVPPSRTGGYFPVVSTAPPGQKSRTSRLRYINKMYKKKNMILETGYGAG
jgi:hypothetical protein